MIPYSFSPALIIASLLAGIMTAYVAHRLNRNPYIWFFVGAIGGLLLSGGILFVLSRFGNKGEEKTKQNLKEITSDSLVVSNPLPCFLEKQEWYYLNENHQQQGPFPFQMLKKHWKEGNIAEKTFVWCFGMSEWKTIQELHPLRESLE